MRDSGLHRLGIEPRGPRDRGGEFFVASDAAAILKHTRSVVYLDDGDIAVLTPSEYHVIDCESHVQLRAVNAIAWDLGAIELGGYPHL